MPAISVSSAQFLKSYGRISDAALREPVAITSHGRERLVLMSAEQYRRIMQNYRVALHPSELTDDEIKAIELAEPSAEAAVFDHEME